MNNDYLWDKTGSDAEIEKFEASLQGLGYQEDAAPSLPGKVVHFTAKPSSKLFRYAMAAAACLMFAVFSLGIWMQISTRDGEDEISLADSRPSDNAPDMTAKNINSPDVDFVANTKPASKVGSENRKYVSPVAYKSTAKTKNTGITKPAKKLTKEEEYAYGQLKLALAITGSNLKLIRDKVERIEDLNTVPESGR
jgi:hypothetical protein